MSISPKSIVFANGCFWCTEAVFKMVKGVISVTPGYAGGHTENPTYDKVAGGHTGHAECLKIDYDPNVISFEDLLIVFFFTHDPTTLNRQGNDVGTEYRSAIFYTDSEQKFLAEKMIEDFTVGKAYENPIVTEVKPLERFYPAESYHKDYYKNNKDAPYCQLVIAPKLEKFEKKFGRIVASHP